VAKGPLAELVRWSEYHSSGSGSTPHWREFQAVVKKIPSSVPRQSTDLSLIPVAGGTGV
jgi:hypothetical protein